MTMAQMIPDETAPTLPVGSTAERLTQHYEQLERESPTPVDTSDRELILSDGRRVRDIPEIPDAALGKMSRALGLDAARAVRKGLSETSDAALRILQETEQRIQELDPRFSKEHREKQAQTIRDEAQNRAADLIQERCVEQRSADLRAMSSQIQGLDVLRRAPFTDDPDDPREDTAALRWVTTASRMSVAELVATVRDAVDSGRWAVAHAMRRELMHRWDTGGPDAGREQIVQAAKEVDAVLSRALAPMLREAKRLSSDAVSLRASIDRAFAGSGGRRQ